MANAAWILSKAKAASRFSNGPAEQRLVNKLKHRTEKAFHCMNGHPVTPVLPHSFATNG